MGLLQSILGYISRSPDSQEIQGQDVGFNVTGDARRNLTRALRLLQCRDQLDSAGLTELNARLAHAKQTGVDVSSVASITEALNGCV